MTACMAVQAGNCLLYTSSYEEAKDWLQDKLSHAHPYGPVSLCLASGVGGACFSMLLGGNFHDFLAAFAAGFIAMAMLKLLNTFRPSAFWENFLAGFAIGIVSLTCCYFDRHCTCLLYTSSARRARRSCRSPKKEISR